LRLNPSRCEGGAGALRRSGFCRWTSPPSRPSVLVLGGGPAGSAVAVALARGGVDAEIRLAYRETNQEAIGETIPPAATPALRGLGVEELLDAETHLICPGSVSLWGSDQPGYNDFFVDPSGRGFHLDRTRFDADLRQAAAELGVRICPNRRLHKVETSDPGFRLWFSVGSESEVLEADFVIDASGQSAAFARRLGVARNLFDEVISICAFVDAPEPVTSAAPTLVEAREQGWWYGARLPGGRAIVSLCTDREALQSEGLSEPERWLGMLQQAEWFHEQFRSQLGRSVALPKELHLKPARSAILSNVIGDAWLAVGDAASSYDSMTSAGITKALIHARQAGSAVAALLGRDPVPLHRYQDQVFADFNQYMELHQQHYRSETRFTASPFWRNRLRRR